MALPLASTHESNSILPFDSPPTAPKCPASPVQDSLLWSAYKLTGRSQESSEESAFSDHTSTTDGSASEGSDTDTDDEGSVRRRPLSDAPSEYLTFIPQSLSLPQGLGIQGDDGGDLSEPDEASSVSTSRRNSGTGRTGPSNRIASSVSMKCFPTSSQSAKTGHQYAPRSAPSSTRQSIAMSAAIQEWHIRQARLASEFGSDDSDDSEPESIKDNERGNERRSAVADHTAVTIELEQDVSDEEGFASSCSSPEEGQPTAERSAASRRLFAALNNREGKADAAKGDTVVSSALRSQHRSSSPTPKALSHRRGHSALPSLQQIQSRVAAGPSSAVLHHARPPLRNGVSSPGSLPSYHTPGPMHQRVASCPTPSLSGKWWNFGQVAVIITPPTPCPQVTSPLVGYILQNAGTPVHSVNRRRSKDDLDMLIPPPFELAPGRQQMMEDREKERANAQALMKQSQEAVMAALTAMTLATERSRSTLGKRSSINKGSGQIIGLGWPGSPGSPGTPLPSSLGGSGGGRMPLPGLMLPPPVPSSAPPLTASCIVDFAPSSLPRRPTPRSAGPATGSCRRGGGSGSRRGRSPPSPRPPPRDTTRYVAPGRRTAGAAVEVCPPAGLPRRPSVECSAAGASGQAVQCVKRLDAGRKMVTRLHMRRGEAEE